MPKLNTDGLDAPAFALELYPNGALSCDPWAIGSFDWPNNITLPAELNKELTHFLYDLIGDPSLRPANQILHSLFHTTGTLSFNLSYYNLLQKAQSKNLPGIFFDLSKPPITNSTKNTDSRHKPNLKDFIAVKGQKILFHALNIFGYRWKISASPHAIYDKKTFGKIYLIRRTEAIFKVELRALNEAEERSTLKLARIMMEKVSALAVKHDIKLDDKVRGLLQNYINNEFYSTRLDLKSLKRFFGSIQYNLYERSLTVYTQSLFSVVCKANGGEAHSMYHGVCQTANEPDIATMVNSSVFWGVTNAFAIDARELALRITSTARNFEVRQLGREDHYKVYLQNDRVRKEIKHIAVMGRPVVQRYSAFNSLEFSTYLELEKKITTILLDQGYKVTYKAHPESEWLHFDQYFDPRVKIDWRPFEPIMEEFDALFFHFGASSTMPYALGSHLHIFMLQDGWHDIKIWPKRLQKFFKIYTNMISGSFNKRGLIDIDEIQLINAFKSPVSFDKKQRVRDFFCREVF